MAPKILPTLLLLVYVFLTPTLSQNPNCDGAWFWNPDDTTSRGNADWSSWGQSGGFGKGPCIQLSGIGMTITSQSTIIIVDRNGASNGYINLPNGNPAFGQEIILGSNRQRPLDVLTNTFCSSGQHMPDGSLLIVGGDYTPDRYLGTGIASVRSFTPCRDGRCGFSIRGQLQRGRWYPTTALLGDGTMVVVGGAGGGVGLNTAGSSVPNIEYFPANGRGVYDSPLLWGTLPYNLFPFVHLLPSGNLFIFAGSKWVIWSTGQNRELPGARPELVRFAPNGKQIFRSYPLTGTSALFPLLEGYPAEILICGGQNTAAAYFGGSNPNVVADAGCFTIQPESRNPQWNNLWMARPRVGGNAVLLPDGHIMIVNGLQSGWAGLGIVGHRAALKPELFNTYTRQWFPQGQLPFSKIPRSYHSSAVLTGDGSVFISGSNQHSRIEINNQDFPTEFRTEFFYPPYASGRNARVRPQITASPGIIPIGGYFDIEYTKPKNLDGKVFVVLAHPGYSTHSNNHGMRNVLLPVRSVTKLSVNRFRVRVGGCPNKNSCPPQYYWLFAVVGGVPNVNTRPVFVR